MLILKARLITLACLGTFLLLPQVFGQSTPRPGAVGPTREIPATKPDQGSKKKQTAGPLNATVRAIDRTAGTIVIGNRTFTVNAQTRITKGGKPATLADGIVGEKASGYFKTSAEGKMVLSSLRFGPKPPPEAGTTPVPAQKTTRSSGK